MIPNRPRGDDQYSDGIDPDCCRNVRIADCRIESRDDAIVAKASLHATLDATTPGVTCLLKAGGDGDQADVDLSSSSDDPVALVTTHTFAAAGTATLTCAADDTGVLASDARILALRVTALASP